MSPDRQQFIQQGEDAVGLAALLGALFTLVIVFSSLMIVLGN